MQKIKAVIFDLDGTLGNTLPLCVEAFKRTIEPLANRSLSEEEIIATFGPSEEGTIMALAPDYYDKGVSEYIHYYKILHQMCPVPFEGIRDLMVALKEKQVHIAMVTGKGRKTTDISLKQFGLSNFFEFIETGVPSGPIKAESIQIILNLLKDLKKDEIIYVGDSPGDIVASRKVGIPVIAAAWADTAKPEELKALKPDELFYNISDFSNWLYSKI
jgi:phosphoglycolate phosphatase-like HAD superfamily hydrolase